jgi:hypothetical protein
MTLAKAADMNRIRNLALPAALIAGESLLRIAGPFSFLLVLLLPAVLLWCLMRKRLYLALAVVFLNAVTLGFVEGIAAWAVGGASMLGTGYPWSRNASIDPFTRLPFRSSGCIVRGDEWVRMAPHNAGIELMTLLFGPSPGAYRGPIPSEKEARAAVEGGTVIDWRDLAGGQIRLNEGLGARIDPKVGTALLGACYLLDPQNDSSSGPVSGSIRAALWQNRVLLVELGEDEVRDPELKRQLAALDVERGVPFRYFAGNSCDDQPRLWSSVEPR